MTTQLYSYPPSQFFTSISANYEYATQLTVPIGMTVRQVSLALKTDSVTKASQSIRVTLFGADAVTRMPTTKLGEASAISFSGGTSLPDLTQFVLVTPVVVTSNQVIYVSVHGGDLSEGTEPVVHVGYRQVAAPPNGGTVVGYDTFSDGSLPAFPTVLGSNSLGFTVELSDTVASPVTGQAGALDIESSTRIWPRIQTTTAQAVINEVRIKLRDPGQVFITDAELLLHLSDSLRSCYPSFCEVHMLRYEVDPDASYEYPISLKLPLDGDSTPLFVQFRQNDWVIGVNNYTIDPVTNTLQVWDTFNVVGKQSFSVALLKAPASDITLASTLTPSHRWLAESTFIRAVPQVQAMSGEDRSMDVMASQQVAGTELMRAARAPSIYDDGTVV